MWNVVKRFGRDERGVFAVTFGLMAIVLIAMGGAVVDYVWLEQTRNRAQVALDAAALGLQDQIFVKPLNKEDIRKKAEELVKERVADSQVTSFVNTIEVDVTDGTLYLAGQVGMPTMFVNLVGVPQLTASIQSEATRKKLELEVVMVLDNSGSMDAENRMTNLINAAKCATYTLFYSAVQDASNGATCVNTATATVVDKVKMGVVPFTTNVNVGVTSPVQSWIDSAGTSSIANDNFDNDDDDSTAYTGAVNRLGLFTAMGTSWKGCVEARPHTKSGSTATEYYDTDDTLPNSAVPDTLFVPMLSTDLPDTIVPTSSGLQSYLADSPPSCDRPSNGGASCTQRQVATNCNSNRDNGACAITGNTFSFTGPRFQTAGTRYVGDYPPSCTCRDGWSWSSWNQTSGSGSNRTFERTRTCSNGYTPTGLSDREYQERICKFSSTPVTNTTAKGPNSGCIETSVLPLTKTVASVISKINAMTPLGGTDIHEGAAWGFRTLSPSLPFNEGNSYGTATSKVMILMTDGENTAYNLEDWGSGEQQAIRDLNGSAFYSAYGWPINGRLSPPGSTAIDNPTLVSEMNARTLQTCTNAKNAGITIYTIGLATAKVTQSTQAVVEDMLRKCASNADMAYFPQQSSELKAVFQDIAGQLSQLRLVM